MPSPRFGKVQLQIMQVLWEKGKASAREITGAMNQKSPIAHSTVQTLLRELENKKAVAHDTEERTFIFYPLVKPENVKRSATRELIDRVFDGSASGLVSYLLKNEKISERELRQIKTLIDPKE